MKAGQHLQTEGLQDIVNLRASINLGLSEDLKTAFPNTIPVIIPCIPLTNLIPNGWLDLLLERYVSLLNKTKVKIK